MKAILNQLIDYCCDGITTEEFLESWEKEKNTLDLEDILATVQEGQQTDKTIIWLLADAATRGAPVAFAYIWDKFGEEIPFEKLHTSVKSGPDRDLSVLWFLAFGASDHPELFLKVWEKHEKNIEPEVLLEQCKEGQYKGISALWSLADAAGRKEPSPLLKAWDKIKGALDVDDLTHEAEETDKGKSALLLILEAMPIRNADLTPIINDILYQIPGIIDPKYIPALSKFRIGNTEQLITTRNTLFRALKANHNEKCSEELINLAASAAQTGYVNAYFNLSVYFYHKDQYDLAYESCLKLSKQTWHAQDVVTFCAEYEYGKAKKAEHDSDKDRHLRVALHYALLITEEDIAIKNIKRIASFYISNDLMQDNVLPADLIDSMRIYKNIQWCFNRFDEFKKQHLLETANAKLVAELSEAKKLITTLHNTVDSFIPSPLEQQTPSFLPSYINTLDHITEESPTLSPTEFYGTATL